MSMICYKGKVLTVDSNDTVAGYLVEDKGRIVYVGNELPEQYKNVQIVELGKKVLVPAFVDTHQHMASFSTFHLEEFRIFSEMLLPAPCFRRIRCEVLSQ